ncbi:MAG: glycosyltransferase [Bacteroidetes bacterium]|nr:glycosyltransferase [Bacteroidota bacterium]HET6244033.1 glycosyltransferase [Bacteroidia bacterium]
MHVLIIANAYPDQKSNLPGIFIEQQAIALKEKEIKIGVITVELKKLNKIVKQPFLAKSEETVYTREDIPVFKKSALNLTPFLHYFPKYYIPLNSLKLFEKYIEKYGKPQLIHAHFGLWSGYAAMKIHEKYKIPYIITEHTSYFVEKKYNGYELRAISKAYDKSSAIITVSSALKKEVIKNTHNKEVRIIPNMIDTSFFKPDYSVIKEDMIFSLGNLIKTKGQDILIKAFALIAPAIPSYKLVIGGDGPEKENLIELATQLAIQEKIIFPGNLTRIEIRNYLHKSKCFALPSKFETFGIVYMEAIACGVPVVATKCGGPEDFINQNNGILCETDNIEEIAHAMKSILMNLNSYNLTEMHSFVNRNYSKENISQMLVNLYQEKIKG